MYYENLLNELTLKDLYSGELQKYMFNLPQFMMSTIKMYVNHCYFVKKYTDDNNSWVAGFRKKVAFYDPTTIKGFEPLPIETFG
jgi:hypothetical protein